MPYTGEGRSRPSTATGSPSRGVLAGWLSGTAAGSALDSLSRPDTRQTTPDATPTRLRKSQPAALDNPSTTPRPSVSTTASRFMSALSTRLTQPSSPVALAADRDDELYNLDVESALFPAPTGSPSSAPRDAFSPAAFKNLHANAAGALGKLHAAYRAKAVAVRDLEADRSARRDELEEAVTRAAHLRAQLEGMAARAAEQEAAMGQLMGELMAEKRAREEERRRLEVGVRQQRAASQEDMGVDDHRSVGGWRRKSSGTSGSYDETTDEDEEEEGSSSVDEESVFSGRSRSPTTLGGSTVDGGSSVDVPLATATATTTLKSGTGTVRAATRSNRDSGAQMPLSSAFQKIFKGVVGDAEDTAGGCRNCEGRDASVAWDTVSVLRDENKHLKQRVGQLEVAVEGALDMVNGLGL